MVKMVNGLNLYLWTRVSGENGVTMVEYAIMLALVALAIVVFGPGISDSIQTVFTAAQNAL